MTTTKQIRYFHWLANKNAMTDDEKKSLIYGVSNGRTTHVNELDRVEIVHAINYLKGDAENTHMMMKMIAQAHEMGWETHGGRVDIDRLNQWAIKHTPYHKPLNELRSDQMAKVVSLFGKVYLSLLKNL